MKKWIQYSIFLIIGVVLAWYASKDVDFGTIWSAFKKLHWGWAISSMFISYLSVIIRGLRWNIILEPLGYRANPISAVHAVAFGYLMNDLVPRSGEIARCAILSKSEQIPANKLLGTVILERIVDVMTLILVICFVTFMKWEEISFFINHLNSSKGNNSEVISFWILIFVLVSIAGALLFIWALKKWRHLLVFAKIYTFILGMWEGILSITKIKHIGLFVLYTAGIWLCWMLTAYFLLIALPETNNVTLIDSLYIMVAGGLGMIVPTQGGLGSYHMASKWSFEALQRSGAIGLIYAWVSWVFKTIVELLTGTIGFVFLNKKHKNDA